MMGYYRTGTGTADRGRIVNINTAGTKDLNIYNSMKFSGSININIIEYELS